MFSEVIDKKVNSARIHCEEALARGGFTLDDLTYLVKLNESNKLYCCEISLSIRDKKDRRYSLCVKEVDVRGYLYGGLVDGMSRSGDFSGELRDFMYIVEAFSNADPYDLEASFVHKLRNSFGVRDWQKFPKVNLSRKDESTIKGLIIREANVRGEILRAPRYQCTLKADDSVFKDERKRPTRENNAWNEHARWAPNPRAEKFPDFIKYPKKRPRGWPSGGSCNRCGSTNVEIDSMPALNNGFWITYTCLYCNFKRKKWER